jgi:predicted GH43/DUF377 family glycosyl hydrolase
MSRHNSFLCDYTVKDLEYVKDIDNDKLKGETSVKYTTLKHTHYLNGSVVKYRDYNLFVYRTEQEPFFYNTFLHICQLDDRYQPMSESVTLRLETLENSWQLMFKERCSHIDLKSIRSEDPRVLVVGNELYLVYCDGFKVCYTILDPKFINDKLVDCSHREIYIPKPPPIKIKGYDGREKNWTPFDKDGQLWILYNYHPLVFFRLDGDEICDITVKQNPLPWSYGIIRGGTPAILDGRDYLTVFHSCHISDRGLKLYIVGCFRFSKDLEPVQISRYPLMIPLSNVDSRLINDQVRVLFPAGIIRNDDHLVVSMGYNDHTNKILILDRSVLEYNLSYKINEISSMLCNNTSEDIQWLNL